MDLKNSEFPAPDRRVVQFCPRRKKSRPDRPDKSRFPDADGPSPVRNLASYQRTNGRDDYGHRMRMNAVVFAFTTTLIVAGVWIVTLLSHPHS